MRQLIQLLFILFFLIAMKLYFIQQSEPSILSHDDYLNCIYDIHRVFEYLSIRWFFTFGTALAYWRSKNFISNDMDIGIFRDDLPVKSLTNERLIEIMTKKFYFKFLHQFGEINHGKEWSFQCPNSSINLDIFVFYHFNQSNDYWTATYTDLCDKMLYRKCRWKFRNFQIESFKISRKLFFIVPLTFIKERYGENYTIKHNYDYYQSLKFLPNLIREYDQKNNSINSTTYS